jgi:hypothetical protein
VGDPRALGYALGRLEEAQPPMALLTASLDMDALELAESALTLNWGPLDPALLIELLDAAAREFANPAEMHFYSHALHTVLERLRAEGSRWHEDVLRLEQALLPSLDLFAGHHPKALYAKIADGPADFVELVRRTHPQHEMDEASRSNYQRAQHMLFHWNTLRGQHGSNLDFEKWSAWVTAARTQPRQAGLGEAARYRA